MEIPMSSTTPASAQRFAIAPDDCTAVIDTKYVTATPTRAAKVLCRAVNEADAAFVARACNAYEHLVDALAAGRAVVDA